MSAMVPPVVWIEILTRSLQCLCPLEVLVAHELQCFRHWVPGFRCSMGKISCRGERGRKGKDAGARGFDLSDVPAAG